MCAIDGESRIRTTYNVFLMHHQLIIVSDVPAPKYIGLRNIMLIIEAPENWYMDSTQARNTSSSVIGA